MADEGVVGCVESASEGGCEVDGVSVSISDGAAMVDVSDSSGPSVGVSSGSSACTSWASSSVACSRVGNASPSSVASTGPLLRFFFCEALGGNATSGTDSQGNGGWNGLRTGDGCRGGALAKEDLDGVLDGGRVPVVMLAEGVGELTKVLDATDGDEGTGWGVWMRITAGGVCEWAMGGVCTSERLTGGMCASGWDETTTGEPWCW